MSELQGCLSQAWWLQPTAALGFRAREVNFDLVGTHDKPIGEMKVYHT